MKTVNGIEWGDVGVAPNFGLATTGREDSPEPKHWGISIRHPLTSGDDAVQACGYVVVGGSEITSDKLELMHRAHFISPRMSKSDY